MNLHRLIFLLFSLPFTLTTLAANTEKVSAKAFLYAGRKMVLQNCDIASAKCGNEQLKIRKQDPSPND
ncbi:MAG TPA: hypothetical protein VJ001_08775, partial [Rhodocyclaceae bacterium]|nr:hypothetical protein [Rhodocyclaceae bacterium]